jgi:hypothetical protein
MAYQPDERARDDVTDPPKIRTTTEARQGVTGHKVRYVLYWGLGILIVIYAVIYFLFLK